MNNSIKDKIKNEEEFIALLLKNKDLVSEWLESGIEVGFFEDQHKLLLQAIHYAFTEDVLLTRKTFVSWLNQNAPSRNEIPTYETVFVNINFLQPKKDDFPLLKKQIINQHVIVNSVSAVERFRNSMKNGEEPVFIAKKLAAEMSNVVTDNVDVRPTIYESIQVYAPNYLKELKEKKEKGVDLDVIKCGIKEIDETMVIGHAPGELTLYGADVGNFKCVSDCYISTYDGKYTSVTDLYEKYKKGENCFILSLDESTGKTYLQKFLSINDNGTKECFKVSSYAGHELSATHNHPFLTFNGYKKLEDLKVGDRIAVARKGVFGNFQPSCGEAVWLGAMIADGGCSQKTYGFTNVDKEIIKVLSDACVSFGCELICSTNELRTATFHLRNANKYRSLGKKYGIDGKLAIHKSIHSEVFSWNRESIKILLQAMYGCDGSFSAISTISNRKKIQYQILYCTSSHQLAVDVRNILLKFGLVGRIFTFMSKMKRKDGSTHEREAYRVVLSSAADVAKFIKEIGFLGEKQVKAEVILPFIEELAKVENPNLDLIPCEVWDIVKRKFKEYGKTEHSCRRFLKGQGATRSNCPPLYNRITSGVSRQKLRKIAEFLNNDEELLKICDAEIYWDEIVSIESSGVHQTYDIAMPVHHNFVANNIITHNTTMMLNVANNIWDTYKKNVLFVPLEMQRNRFYQKLLSRVARIPFDRIEHPSILTEAEWVAIEKATDYINKKADSQFYIMEKADRTNVSAIRREIEKHIEIFKPHVVVIDYVGILMPDKGQLMDRNDLQIGHMLKDLRQMGKAGVIHKDGFHTISGVQIGREALKRVRRLGVDKIGFNSEDLRGSHEYSADATTIYAQMKDPAQPNSRLNFFVIKSRFGKTVFPNGETRATLSVNPGISLIESVDDGWLPRKRTDILAKVDDSKLDEEFDLGDIEGIQEDKPSSSNNHPKTIKAPQVEIEDEFSDLNNFEMDGIL